jgi:hypothetical protein
MNDIKFFIGPMSKNVVDSIIEFTEETGNKIGFIPSRRQVEFNGGYVNNWTTKEFSDYVDGRVPIERDHGGARQGYTDDDGYESFKHDAENFDIIHIDPWKKYPNFDDGLKETLATINYINNMNPNTLFEVGTEEAIRKFTPDELHRLLEELSNHSFFNNIKYAVVQSGVGLDLGKRVNTGTFDGSRLKEFVDVCERWNVLSKEHNGDYLTNGDIKARFEIGLSSLNIAPEFGQLETLCYLEHMGDDIEDYYRICYYSNRWKKWVDNDFVPEDNKKELIKICGHYVLSDEKFLDIKPNIDSIIKSKIKNKLGELCHKI